MLNDVNTDAYKYTCSQIGTLGNCKQIVSFHDGRFYATGTDSDFFPANDCQSTRQYSSKLFEECFFKGTTTYRKYLS